VRCSTARRRRLDVELSLATPAERAAWEAHVSACPACAAWTERERSLTAALTSCAGRAPIEIDVTARVMAELSRVGPAPREAFSTRLLAWWLSLTALGGVALVAAFWALLPDAASLGGDARLMILAVGRVFGGLSVPLAGVVSALSGAAGALAALLRTVLSTLKSLEPAAVATVVCCTVTMTATIVVVLGRDLRRPRWLEEGIR